MAYIFYDTETTGTNTDFDQILQFAGIKTDDDLNELDRFEIRCRLLPHIVPAPGALLITGVTPELLIGPALPSHYEAIKQIRNKLIEWSPAIFIGYNSIKFDEGLLRQAFFQTLLPVYFTNTNGNSRGDVLRVAHAASVYTPDSIVVAVDDKGKPTFRLERLAPANGYNHDDAHEAMADVLATIHMARHIRDRAPEVWQAMSQAAKKSAVIDRVTQESMLAMTERYGPRIYSWIVACCGSNPGYNNELAVFDLNHDPDKYRGMSVENLVSVLNASPKVIRSVRANAQPILMPIGAHPELKKVLQITLEEATRRAEIIRADKGFQERVGQALALRYDDVDPSGHVEQRIYEGFPTRADEALMQRFHEAGWDERVAIAGRIADERLKELAHRLVFFEQPNSLPTDKSAELKKWRAERMSTENENVPWMTIPKAQREADRLLRDASGKDARLLADVKAFLTELEGRITAE